MIVKGFFKECKLLRTNKQTNKTGDETWQQNFQKLECRTCETDLAPEKAKT